MCALPKLYIALVLRKFADANPTRIEIKSNAFVESTSQPVELMRSPQATLF